MYYSIVTYAVSLGALWLLGRGKTLKGFFLYAHDEQIPVNPRDREIMNEIEKRVKHLQTGRKWRMTSYDVLPTLTILSTDPYRSRQEWMRAEEKREYIHVKKRVMQKEF